MSQPIPSDDMVIFLRTMRDAIDTYLERVGSRADGGAPAPPREREPATDGAPPAAAARSAPAAGGTSAERARTALLAGIVDQTGYPEELVEGDLDLEGDLGIDTVKQVAILSGVRSQFGLDVDPEFRLRDHNTLNKLAAYVGGRLDAAGR